MFALTYSTGTVEKVSVPNAPGGVARTFVLDPTMEKVGMYELFMFLWIVAFAIAWEQLTSSIAVMTW